MSTGFVLGWRLPLTHLMSTAFRTGGSNRRRAS
jgi:hypothetical protein